MTGQLRIVAEFMNLADSCAMQWSSQEYLDLCDDVQFAHALVKYQPLNGQEYIVIDTGVVVLRHWRHMKRSYLAAMTNTVLHAERIERAKLRHVERVERAKQRCLDNVNQ